MTGAYTIAQRRGVHYEINWKDGSCGSIQSFPMDDGDTLLIGSFHSRPVGRAKSRATIPLKKVVSVSTADEVWEACGTMIADASRSADIIIERGV